MKRTVQRVARWALILALGLAGTLAATEVRIFQQQSRSDFADGELDGLAIGVDGSLRRAAHFERLAEIEEPFVFAAAKSGTGWVLATGNSGRVIEVSASGASDVLWTAPEPEIFALFRDHDGTVYAGSSPDGKVYALRGGGGEEIFDPQETYIWAITRAPWGDLLVATGDEGKLYAIGRGGESRLLYASDEPHFRSLHALEDRVLVGTSGEGLILSVDEQGVVRTLHDADAPEVVAFATGENGDWYAAVVASEAGLASSSRSANGNGNGNGNNKQDEDEGESVQVSVEAASQPETPPKGEARSVIVRGRGGAVEEIERLTDETVYSLAWVEGRLWVGTGVEGKVYSRHDDGLALETTVADRQVIGVFGGTPPSLVTTNAAAVHRVAPDAEVAGSYASKPLDARSVARFGTLRWVGTAGDEAALRYAFRTGSSSKPDQTWSAWTEGASGREVSLAEVPSGRYLQWRLDVAPEAGADTRVSAVEISYRQSNRPPTITALAALPPGQVLVPASFNPGDQTYEPAHPNRDGIFTRLEPSVRSSNGRLKTLWRRGYLTLRWEAGDPNEDQLEFALHFRRDGSEGEWLPLADELEETHYGFDATVLPDGIYRIRLTASDAPANPADDVARVERVSPPIVVDHSPPSLGTASAGLVEIVDELSPIRGAEVSIDAAEWVPAVAKDGLLDGRTETVIVESPPEAELVLLRVMDAAFNTTTFEISGDSR